MCDECAESAIEWGNSTNLPRGITRLFWLWIVLQTGGRGGAIAERQYYAAIMSSVVHLDHDNCLEVSLARGKSSLVQKLANSLNATKGVKRGRFSITVFGRDFR